MNAMLRAQQEVFDIMPDSKIGMEMVEAFEEAERSNLRDAAPELLEALKMLLASAHDFQTGISEAEAAIAKAEGRPCDS